MQNRIDKVCKSQFHNYKFCKQFLEFVIHMKNSPNTLKIKPKCPHKLSKSPNKPKTARYHTTIFDNYQTNIIRPTLIKPKQQPLKNNQKPQPLKNNQKPQFLKKNQNSHHTNYELCKQATLCYYGLKEVIRIEAVQRENQKLKEQNSKLKDENIVYGEYFRQFEGRFKEQKEQIKKLKQQNVFLKSRNAKIQQLNSTLSCNTTNPAPLSYKQSHTTRSAPKYFC